MRTGQAPGEQFLRAFPCSRGGSPRKGQAEISQTASERLVGTFRALRQGAVTRTDMVRPDDG